MATDYTRMSPAATLFEIKGGDWGFPDIFKVFGWMHYLTVHRGAVVVRKKKEAFSFCRRKAAELGITLTGAEDHQSVADAMVTSQLVRSKPTSNDIESWRFSHWIERNMLKRLNTLKKSDASKKCFSTMEKQIYIVNSGSFFTNSPAERAMALYNTYKGCPRLTAKSAHELEVGVFDENAKHIPSRSFNDTYVRCIYSPLHISTYIEHRSRLTILKSAVDYVLSRQSQGASAKHAASEDVGSHLIALMPQTFKKVVENLHSMPQFERYPVFWQWFLWFFGGFILLDRKDDEYRLLSEKTGVSVDNIPAALEVYNALFPSARGWFVKSNNLMVLKCFSVPFCGLGANYRKMVYANGSSYDTLRLPSDYAIATLKKWHNLAYTVLRSG